MYVNLEKHEVQKLSELVQWRIGELHSEVRRSMDYHYKDKLKAELIALQRLEHSLHEAECDVKA